MRSIAPDERPAALMETWNRILRWAHFLAMPADGWSDTVNNIYKFAIVGFAF